MNVCISYYNSNMSYVVNLNTLIKENIHTHIFVLRDIVVWLIIDYKGNINQETYISDKAYVTSKATKGK